MLNSGYTCAKFDNEDVVIALLLIAFTIFYVGQHQGVRYKVLFSVIVAVEVVLIGLLWWALRGIGPC
jgi:Flp pilus assembly protein protease CpaA